MSNALAIATVTASLQQLLQKAIENSIDLKHASAVIGYPRPPTKMDEKAEVVITLYEVAPNMAYRNSDLPMRNLTGAFVEKPSVAAELYYLFIFYGNEQRLEPQRLLGTVMSVMHANPVLTTELIQATINSELYEYLKSSDLATANKEQVKFTLHSVALEDISKLWSAFYQSIPYSLAISYRASMVLINVDEKINVAPDVLTPQVVVDLLGSKI